MAKQVRQKISFNPEGKGYDMETALQYGLEPDEKGHWPSRVPETGLLLKGRKHKTWFKTKRTEAEIGCKIVRKGKFGKGRYYSICPDDKGK